MDILQVNPEMWNRSCNMNLDADLYSPKNIPLKSAQEFVVKILPQLGWDKSDGDEVVFDAGCGPGGTTKNLVLSLFSSSSRIFAVDAMPDMIALAKEQNSCPQIEYSVANIEDWSSLQRWKNQITKLVSISVFQWLKDQRRAFRYVHRLLQEGGQAAFFFPLQTPFFASTIEMQNSPRWSHYTNGVENYVPKSQNEGHDASYYNKMMEELGFEVLYCKSEEKIDVFHSEDEFREFFTSICVLRKYVPEVQLKDFENDFIENMHRKNGRTIDGRPFHKGNFLELVVRKCVKCEFTETDFKPTLYYDTEAYSQMDKPWDSIVRFLYVTLADLGWYKGTDEEVVMDVGCGPGRLTSQFILPCFPNLKKLIALDAVPSMIEMAKSLYPHPKIEYVVANFEDDSAVECWKGQVTKFISVHCFNRMKSQYDAFKRIYELLPPNGEAALYFLLHNGYYANITKLAKDPKWQPYITINVEEKVPESQAKKYSSLHYKKMLKDIGFKVLHCQQVQNVTTFPTDEECANFYSSVSELVPCIPDSKAAEFKKDLFDCVSKENGRNTDGTPVDKTTTLELVLRK